MAKKLKKQKKLGMSPKAKFTLVSVFKSLYSNQAAIDGSKESPWWVAAIFFVFAVLLPLVPGFAKLSTTNGGAFLSSVNYNFDVGGTAFAYNMKVNDHELKVKGGKLHYYVGETEDDSKFVTPDDEYIDNRTATYSYVNSSSGQYSLRVYIWGGLSSNKLSSYVNKVAKQKYVIGTTSLPNPEATNEKYYIPNILVITPKTLALALYKERGTSQVATSSGGLDWTNSTTKYGLIERLLKAGIKAEFEFTNENLNTYLNTYKSKTLKQYVKIFNETYLNQKNRTKWTNTGIYAAIYAGIILFLGLMIFILTRGKNNPYKFLNVWHCQKIAWWASFSPAVIGLVVSMIFTGSMISQMAFILVASLRVMWLSMKQLRPVYQDQR